MTNSTYSQVFVGWDSSVGSIAIHSRLDGPGIESRWGQHFPGRPWGPPSLLYNGYRVFPGGKAARDMALTTHPIYRQG